MESLLLKMLTLSILTWTLITAIPLNQVSALEKALQNANKPCAAIEFDMVLKEPGCKPKIIKNKLCSGQCHNMFYVKNGQRSKQSKCSLCQPKDKFKTVVYFDCEKVIGGTTQSIKVSRDVTIIKECSCKACS